MPATPRARSKDTGAVHAGVSLHFNIVFQHRGAGLGDFFPTVPVAGKAKSVTSHDRPILQDDMVAEDTVLAHDRVGMREEVCANARAAIDDHVRQEHRIASNLDIVVDNHIGRNVGILADPGSRGDYGGRMHAGFISRRLVKQVDRLGESEVRIFAPQHAG